MKLLTRSLLVAVAATFASSSFAQVTFYEGEGFRGRAFTAQRSMPDFKRGGINDSASSAIVEQGRWEVCEDSRYRGNCVVLRQGSYDSLRGMGMNNRISSMRPVNARRSYSNLAPAPLPAPTYDYRRRPRERVYQAQVTSARAVMSEDDQRCWVEREQVNDRGRGDRNVGGAIAGALIGGILGHQVGDGRGRTAATAGGAAIGAVVGSNAGRHDDRDYGTGYERDVRRCDSYTSGPPSYWDVSYDYRGTEHWVRMSEAPGRTIAVNSQGEPRQ